MYEYGWLPSFLFTFYRKEHSMKKATNIAQNKNIFSLFFFGVINCYCFAFIC